MTARRARTSRAGALRLWEQVTLPEAAETPAGFNPVVKRASWGTRGYFIALFLPVSLLLATITGVIYHEEVRTHRARTRLQAWHDVDANREAVIREFQHTVSDTVLLANQAGLQDLAHMDRAAARSELERQYRVFFMTKQVYDQVRFINPQGEEVVRIRHAENGPAAVPADKLRTQVLEDDFHRALALPRGQMHVGRLTTRPDAAGAVIPIMAFGTPVYDAQGVKHGVLLLDCVASVMLQKVKDQILLDSSGYWLHGGATEDLWGFARKHGAKFSDRFPRAWEAIQATDIGQKETDEEGLFTFNTIYPLREVRQAVSGVAQAGAGNVNALSYSWKVVSHVSPGRLDAPLYRLRGRLAWFYAVLVAIVGIAAMPYARLMARRKDVQEKFREFAVSDSLTHVYNRGFGLEMLGRLINECRRLSANLCVVMIDVNNLKKVNDHFGHKSGDALLSLVANALRTSLREVDIVSRFGGDEFLVVLPFTAVAHAESILARVQQNITQMDTSQFDPYEVGFSFGCSEYDPAQNQAISQLLDLADARMYQHKRKQKVGRV